MSIPIQSGQGPIACTDYQSPYGTRTGTTNSFAQTIAQTQSSSLTLTTAEGDRVTLSNLSRSYQSTQGASWATATSSGVQLASSSASIEAMGLSVQGDLNEQELADITRLVGELTSIASDFFSGDQESAMNKAMDFGNLGLGSISSLSASFSRQTVTQTQITSQQTLPASTNTADSNDQKLEDLYAKMETNSQEEQNYAELQKGRWEQIMKALDEIKRQELEGLYARRLKPQPVPRQNVPDPVLAEQQAPANDPAAENREPEAKDLDVPAEERAAGQMLAHMEQLLHNHPKLSPFAKPLVTTAMERAASQVDQDRSDTARAFGTLREAFHNQLQQRFSPPEGMPNNDPLTAV